jgi:hypothetical protein
MADQTIKSTEEMVGSGHGTKADTLNRLSLVKHETDGTHKADDYLALDTTPQLVADLDPQGYSTNWSQVPTASFTATPASTSTITMLSDLTAKILVRKSLKYVIGGTTYYGQCGAIAAGLLTVNGAPLGGDVTALYYGGGILSQLSYDASVFSDGTANTLPLKTGTVYTIRWKKPKSYLVLYEAYQTIHDTGAHGKVTIKINGTEVNTSAGGLVIAGDATWYSTIVNIATAAYDINDGEDLTIVVTEGGNADGYGLMVNVVMLTP